jgi:CTP synthase
LSGTSPDQKLVEIVELKDHPHFLGCQFHPEFKSRPAQAHPLFARFVKAALQRKEARARGELRPSEARLPTVN